MKVKGIQTITSNFQAGGRHDEMEGRPYFVVPMVMAVEGVLPGSNGSILYNEEGLSKTPQSWNMKPIVVYHPEMNGQGVSACDPDILTNRKIGVIMNTKFENSKLKAEAWLEMHRVHEVDERVAVALENNTITEVSTGLFIDNDGVSGDWNGIPYIGTAMNFRPDHLAILPDKIGACSIEDGAGLCRNQAGDEKRSLLRDAVRVLIDGLKTPINNELSHDGTREQLRTLLNVKFPVAGNDFSSVWVDTVFDNSVIYEGEGGRLFRINYITQDDVVSLVGEPVEVQRVTEFKLIPPDPSMNQKKGMRGEKNMEKKELVRSLVDNDKTQWEKEDIEFLETLEMNQLKKLAPVEETQEILSEETPPAEVPATNDQEDVTAEQYIAAAPEDIRDMLASGLQTHNEKKAGLIAAITANKKCTFTKEHLSMKKVQELEAIAQLAVPETNQSAPALYTGQGGVSPTGNGGEEPLETPGLDFSTK